MSFGTFHKVFSGGADLQDYVLAHASPGDLVVVPHQRLAHQIHHRQRLAALGAGSSAWEPLPLRTLYAWWSELFQSLWSGVALAPLLVRLALWGQALKIAPPPEGPTPELFWTQALDETHNLLCRYGLPLEDAGPDDSSLVAWRRQVTRIYAELLRQGDWLSPGELPAYLLSALREGQITAPPRLLVVGLETPAPLEELWFQELSRRTRLDLLRVRGHLQAVCEAVSLPDPRQEMDWVAARLVELAREGLPLHRLAVTAMDLDAYASGLRRVLGELLGPPQTSNGWAYNFSQGPHLIDAPLFQAAVLPLRFVVGPEAREDLVSLLLSPYYGELKVRRRQLARWDQVFRDRWVDRGWNHLRQAVARAFPGETEGAVLERLDLVWRSLSPATAPAREWCRRLRSAWRDLGFPQGLQGAETEAWTRLRGMLSEVETALASEALTPGEFLDWLNLGARRIIMPGPGIQAAGIQVLGLLEMRGLDFSQVFCLGMNAGTLPAPPRPLPLLAAAEKRLVLGGTYQSQHQFGAALFANLLGAAPHLTLTRPRLVEQEEQVGTPLFTGEWHPGEMAVLSVPHPAWLRSPAVQAAFQTPVCPSLPVYPDQPWSCPFPGEISLSQANIALACPCRFFLDTLLDIRQLPEIGSGLDPRERGRLLHDILARFTMAFRETLDRDQVWVSHDARKLLQELARQALAPWGDDLHWQAEGDRWLGEGGLLWEWLRLEQERFERGWRWLDAEVVFQDLRGPEWPFSLKGRLDRLDYHADNADLVIWDYKSGEIPKARQVFEDLEESQLPCYLLAVIMGRVLLDQVAGQVRAGFIGLKSPRSRHLKHEDFDASPEKWEAAAAAFAERVAALGRRLAAGDFRPDPTPPPAGRATGACKYCPYGLVCGFVSASAPEDQEE